MLTAERLRERYSYDPETGLFRYRTTGGRCHEGEIAGFRKTPGKGKGKTAIKIGVDGEKYFAHRLAWLYMTGEWPRGLVDHKDLNPENNKWLNLRDATSSQSVCNRAVQKSSKSGIKGVWWDAAGRKWCAKIRYEGRVHYLGRFHTAEKASAAYAAAAQRLHGEFARAA